MIRKKERYALQMSKILRVFEMKLKVTYNAYTFIIRRRVGMRSNQ